MIGIIDYGLGNVQAFANSYRRLGVDSIMVREPSALANADRLILPGVGAFDWAMERLEASGMQQALSERVLEDGIPVLGVCVGMQMMAERSDEGSRPGLGWIPGSVERFDEKWFSERTHLPHMGWNNATPVVDEPLFSGMVDPRFYFLHSYYFRPAEQAHSICTTEYGIEFSSAVRRDNIWATQFHPEKSLDWGMTLLKNFSGV